MNNCRCNSPVPQPFEFEIQDKCLNIFKSQFSELFPISNNLSELKNKIICEYLKIIDKLECGIHPDLEFLLEEISLVEIMENE